MVEPMQTPIARQRLGNHVSAVTNIKKDQFALQRIETTESLPGSKSLKKDFPVTTEKLFDVVTSIPAEWQL
jgi:hypothetical protein